MLVVASVFIGRMSALPGISEGFAILNEYGDYSIDEVDGNIHVLYLPKNRHLSAEEYKALTSISMKYKLIDVINVE